MTRAVFRRRTWLCLSLLLSLVVSSLAVAQAPLEVPTGAERLEVGPFASFLEDRAGNAEPEDVFQARLKPFGNTRRNLGYPESVLWLRFTLRSAQPQASHWFLSLADLPMQVELHRREPDGSFSTTRSGLTVHPRSRPVASRHMVFPLTLGPHEVHDYLLMFRTDDTLHIGPTLLSPETLAADVAQQSALEGLYYGIMAALVLYNLFVFVSVRYRAYLFYVVFQLSFALCQLGIDGIAAMFLWPGRPDWDNQSVIFLAAVSYLAGIAFARDLLETRTRTPRLDAILRVLFFVAGGIALASLVTGATELRQFALMYLPVAAVVLVVSAAASLRRGNSNALFFLLGWLLFLIGCVLYPLTALGVIPANPVTPYSLKVGSAAEAILLSFALANRIRLMREENARTQADLLRSREIAAQTLERRVAERTEELSSALDALKATQSRLVHQARLAALGHLVAGVAHEVGNPLNFALGGAKELARRVEAADAAIAGLRQNKPGMLDTAAQNLNEAQQAVALVQEGHRRMDAIIRNLRSFSHAEVSPTEPVDLAEVLDTTLALMESKLRDQEITVEREIDNVPPVQCRPGEMGQLFMNLLLNSCEAMPQGGSIRVSIVAKEATVQIVLRDTGPGIRPEHREAIFDPFFSARSDENPAGGKGTGLGLSISQQIVNRAGGTIRLTDEPGWGAVFEITMPTHGAPPTPPR